MLKPALERTLIGPQRKPVMVGSLHKNFHGIPVEPEKNPQKKQNLKEALGGDPYPFALW